jgi:hypothetical protein
MQLHTKFWRRNSLVFLTTSALPAGPRGSASSGGNSKQLVHKDQGQNSRIHWEEVYGGNVFYNAFRALT